MTFLPQLIRSSVGRKYIMAFSGLGLVGFVTIHMIGNLQVFLGPEQINRYAHFLLDTGELLWAARLALVTLVALHIWTAVTLTVENRRARPVAYAQARLPGASYAARTMIWSGLIIATFVVYHLLHFTLKAPVNLIGQDFHGFHTTLADGTPCHDVYRVVIVGFSHPLVAGFYMLAVGLLCWHLSHGFEALFQSLGLRSRVWDGLIRKLAPILACVLFLGYASIPLAVLCGFGREVLK